MEKKVAHTNQAQKRIRQSEKHRKNNIEHRSMIRTFIKKTLKAIQNKDLVLSRELFKKMESVLDRYSIKNLIHKNTVARYKSRINAKIKYLSLSLQKNES